jgi:hypothetical protein
MSGVFCQSLLHRIVHIILLAPLAVRDGVICTYVGPTNFCNNRNSALPLLHWVTTLHQRETHLKRGFWIERDGTQLLEDDDIQSMYLFRPFPISHIVAVSSHC